MMLCQKPPALFCYLWRRFTPDCPLMAPETTRALQGLLVSFQSAISEDLLVTCSAFLISADSSSHQRTHNHLSLKVKFAEPLKKPPCCSNSTNEPCCLKFWVNFYFTPYCTPSCDFCILGNLLSLHHTARHLVQVSWPHGSFVFL